MELQQAERDVIRPTMRRQPKTPGNKGVEVVMTEPVDETQLRVENPADWVQGNLYNPGNTVWATAASFIGPGAAAAQLNWRMQKLSPGSTDWLNYSWSRYMAGGDRLNFTVPSEGQVRFQCRATTADQEVISTASAQQIV